MTLGNLFVLTSTYSYLMAYKFGLSSYMTTHLGGGCEVSSFTIDAGRV
jgi:hypothetical protein